MYFLVKNIQTYSRPFRGAQNTIKLYQDGMLNIECLVRNMSFFLVHPECLKQKLKQRDAKMLCQFFDSEEYKKKVTAFVETQSKILSKDTIAGLKKIKYQHVLSCAQPSHRKPKIITEPEEGYKKVAKVDTKPKRSKKGTIVEQLLKKRARAEEKLHESPLLKLTKKMMAIPGKKTRHRTTIMPIFLKKLRQRSSEGLNMREQHQDSHGFHSKTARRVETPLKPENVPLYAQILHRSDMYPKKKTPKPEPIAQTSKIKTNEEVEQNPSRVDVSSLRIRNLLHQVKRPAQKYQRSNIDHSMNKIESAGERIADGLDGIYAKTDVSNINKDLLSLKTNPLNIEYDLTKLDNVPVGMPNISSNLGKTPLRSSLSINRIPLRMSSSTAKVPQKNITTKLYPKKNINMNLKSYSELLLMEPTKVRTSRGKKKQIDREEVEKDLKIEVYSKTGGIKNKHKGNSEAAGFKRAPSVQMLMESVSKSRSLDFGDNLEGKNTMWAVLRKQKSQSKEKNRLELNSLFEKVKLGTSKNKPDAVLKTAESSQIDHIETKPPILRLKTPKPPTREEQKPDLQSYTYKIVAKRRKLLENRIKEKFELNPPFWKNTFSVDFAGTSEPKNDRVYSDGGSTKTKHSLDIDGQRNKFDIISKNLQHNLNKPVPHFVEHADKPRTSQLKQYSGYHKYPKYLLRLPKTTPEGYRVLMYGVRDPDPTKMNFNDVVKGFCMYNDCVLSEDGLQDGYIVIFDMKEVGIGHLARVSLPALKCFMYYIQDAHPCRLKSIHVLNTAPWIHHVMRLVVPLVRSELLNLVRFHKGNTPDDFPIELLPMDYGGEAPTVEELDRTTKSLLGKYRDWLVESSHFKADESKRVKKASWWGFFSAKSPQQNELDEKAILKNLQID